ncbi:MAG: radical SAM protein [Candidatus Omnitrophica bacterium]|nr:radical SAM protein [Candidatus Omnitrophota bacterium]
MTFERKGVEEFLLADFQRLVKSVRASNPIFFISGGEPFMRADILDIVAAVAAAGLRCMINTNGAQISARQITALAKFPLQAVIFSLYGPEDLHDTITGVPGSYARTVAAISDFHRQREKTRLILSTTVLSETVAHLPHLIEFVKSLGVDRVKIEHLNFLTTEEQLAQNEYCARTPAAAARTMTLERPSLFARAAAEHIRYNLARIKQKFGNYILIKPLLDAHGLREWYTAAPPTRQRCHFVLHSLFVRPNGEISPCPFLTDCGIGSIAEKDIRQIWRQRTYRELQIFLAHGKLPLCHRCCKR